jgi:hypothetical protein
MLSKPELNDDVHRVLETLEARDDMPDLFHLFARSTRFAGLCTFRLHQIRTEATTLLNVLKTYEDQYKYIERMHSQTQADMTQIRLHLFKKGLGELLYTESDDIRIVGPQTFSPSDLFTRGWHEHSIFLAMGAGQYETYTYATESDSDDDSEMEDDFESTVA